MIRLQNVLKMSSRRICETSWIRFEDVLKTSWKRLEVALGTYGQDEYIGLDQDVLKTSSEDVWLIRILFVFIKTSWRRLEDVFWRRRRRRLQDVFIKTNVCWVKTLAKHKKMRLNLIRSKVLLLDYFPGWLSMVASNNRKK